MRIRLILDVVPSKAFDDPTVTTAEIAETLPDEYPSLTALVSDLLDDREHLSALVTVERGDAAVAFHWPWPR